VPRTLNPQAHQLKRDAFLDVAQRLIVTKGYEEMTIQDVLDELETSRGALYHYFGSKQALLDGVVERFSDEGMATIEPVLEDPTLPALRKLGLAMKGIARFKADQKDLVLAVLEVWNSDANALVRDKVRRLSVAKLMPILSRIVREGIEEGVLRPAADPEQTARVLIYLMLGYQELAGEQFQARHAGTLSFDEVMRTSAAFTAAFERLLGAPEGSVTLSDEATLRFWLG
jgi:AcrR family transcriptional regulator